MRYITVPDAPPLLRAETDEPTETVIPWDDFIRSMFGDRRFLSALDIFTTYDLRAKLLKRKAGDVVEVSDEEWNVLVSVVRRPEFLRPHAVYSLVSYLRAIADAPSKKP